MRTSGHYGADGVEITTAELEPTLKLLGLRELEERLEVSPLGGTGTLLGGGSEDPILYSCNHPVPLCRFPTPTGPTDPGTGS